MTNPFPTAGNAEKFYALDRFTDVSGVSGTGRVAYAVDLGPDNGVEILWNTQWPGVEWLPDMDSVWEVHCHEGKTRLLSIKDDSASLVHAQRLLDIGHPRIVRATIATGGLISRRPQ